MLNRNILNPMLYQNNIQPEWAGIYHNPTDGLISISLDGETWTTIADKNLGASTLYNYGDELNRQNCGNLFAWGNNYAFTRGRNPRYTTRNQKDVTGYGPGNYFSSYQWVTYHMIWTTGDYGNLWGAATGTFEAMQGPCPSYYHVPKGGEFENLIGILTSLGLDTTNGICLEKYLFIPKAGDIGGYTGYYGGGTIQIWCSDGYRLYGNDEILGVYNRMVNNADGCSIRPFKNEPVTPDDNRIKLF